MSKQHKFIAILIIPILVLVGVWISIYFVQPEQQNTTKTLKLSGDCDLKQNCTLKTDLFKVQLSYSGIFKPSYLAKFKLQSTSALESVLIAIRDQAQSYPPIQLKVTKPYIEWEGSYAIPDELNVEEPTLQIVITHQGEQYYAELQPKI